jgi:subtilase family serine protease
MTMAPRSGRLALPLLAAILAAPSLGAQQPAQRLPRITRDIVESERTVLHGNVHPQIAERAPLGLTDKSKPMERMILSLKLAPESMGRLETLLAKQQDPKSPSFHRWLTPQQFGEEFGPARSDINTVAAWLASHGFSVEEIAPSGLTINFSGTVDAVERAFQTTIMDFDIDGQRRHGNTTDPAIPSALAEVIEGIVTLHDIPRPAHNRGTKKLSGPDAAAVLAKLSPEWKGTANGTAGVYTSPVDWAAIYNANATYTGNGTGTGVVIGIVGRTNPGTANWSAFRSVVGLPVNTPAIIVNGTNPGDLGAAEDGEADLDAEWSGGVAPGATVKFVASKSTSSTDGVDLSAQYIVNNNLADVMSTSFGQCEASMGSTETAFYNNLWSQAAAQGITACVSTGDSGAAGCTGGSSTSGAGFSGVNGLASTPYNIAVGATQLSTSSNYWTSAGAPTGYIPETPWNESGSVSGGSGLWSTSSGASSTYAKPAWQVCVGVPAASHRYLPDVSLDGSDMFFGNYGLLVYTQGAMATTGGTSASSPSFAGVTALIVQKYGRQGNANTTLYQMGNAQYGGTGTAVFHDITSGNNTVPGLTGFSAGTGWDEVTGLGTPDVTALVNNWGSTTITAPTITVQPSSQSVSAGNAATFTVVAGGGGLTYQWFKNGATIAGGTSSSYTTPATTTADNGSTFYVKVTNSAGSVTSNTVTLTVTSAVVSVAISPATATLSTGGTQQFTASVTGSTNTAVTWAATGGSISTTGLYTAPTATGVYTVKATSVVDTTKSASATVTVTSAAPKQLVLNPGFESGSASWTASASVIAANGTAEPAHGGTYDAWLCGYGRTHTDYVYQAVAIPGTISKATLTYWLHIDTAETTTTAANDIFKAQVRNSSGTVLATLSTLSNLNKGTGYTQYTFDLSAYKGQTVQLYFTGTENSSRQTSFVLDDINLNVQ